jgi:hypothetical protein
VNAAPEAEPTAAHLLGCRNAEHPEREPAEQALHHGDEDVPVDCRENHLVGPTHEELGRTGWEGHEPLGGLEHPVTVAEQVVEGEQPDAELQRDPSDARHHAEGSTDDEAGDVREPLPETRLDVETAEPDGDEHALEPCHGTPECREAGAQLGLEPLDSGAEVLESDDRDPEDREQDHHDDRERAEERREAIVRNDPANLVVARQREDDEHDARHERRQERPQHQA